MLTVNSQSIYLLLYPHEAHYLIIIILQLPHAGQGCTTQRSQSYRFIEWPFVNCQLVAAQLDREFCYQLITSSLIICHLFATHYIVYTLETLLCIMYMPAQVSIKLPKYNHTTSIIIALIYQYIAVCNIILDTENKWRLFNLINFYQLKKKKQNV